MGRIQSNIGLITGIPIGDTVDKLMQIAARPRDLLIARTENLQNEQIAISELSALLLGVQYAVMNLGKDDPYDQRFVVSSNPAVLDATVTGEPATGSYQFTPIRTAQQHQLLSGRIETDTETLGGGQVTFRFGAHVEESLDLDVLGGGQGVDRGAIRITDRSGASAEIDLSTVQTVDDVLEAINAAKTINVTATAQGDRIRLEDRTGQTVANLRVQEIGSGTTAASLGLAGLDVADDVADGQDVLWLTEDLDLDLLNDAGGVFTDRIVADVEYELRDGTTGEIDLSPIIPGSSKVDEDITLGDVLQRINAAEPGKLKAEIAPDGDRLILTDLTEGEGTFTVESLGESTALADLGLDGDAVDGVITGHRVLGGMKTVLLGSLAGGQGVGELGSLDLTDRSGASATVDLSGAETLDDVIALVNAAGIGINAQVNQARNGIELVDTTGSSAGNLIVANGDATSTADKLQIAVDDPVSRAGSGDMHLQIVARNTRLSDLNGGAGVARGKMTIYDTEGGYAQIDLRNDGIQTVGDVIREINRQGLMVRAELNETGDGIRLRDLAHGNQTLRVAEGNLTAAADLHLLGEAVEVEVGGEMTQVIDGSATYVVELDADDSLTDLRDKINELGAGIRASIWSDGSTKPYRLALHSERSGAAGEMIVDTSALDLSFQETARAQDALLMLGELGAAGSGVLFTSSSNTFADAISGVELEIKQPSFSPVTISVDTSDTNLVATVEAMVANYNRFRAKLEELTQFDPTTNSSSLLTGDATALRLDTDLPYLLSGSLGGAGSIRSLREVGISLKDDGTLQLDKAKLKSKYAQDPQAVKQFFSQKEVGLADRFEDLIERLAGQRDSLLAGRLNVLNSKIEKNEEKIALWNARLTAQRDRMLLSFYRMELAIGKMQTSLSAIDSIKPLSVLIGGSG
ncbi:MAG TPA: flagellar filament capping protein FliD [Thermoguttaceae bacterium]|nr:flagellar filament capping protein FliD [Thermoguttaceae bacterium]